MNILHKDPQQTGTLTSVFQWTKLWFKVEEVSSGSHRKEMVGVFGQALEMAVALLGRAIEGWDEGQTRAWTGEEPVAESCPGRGQFKRQQAVEVVSLGSGVPQSWLCDPGQVTYLL